MSNPKKTEEKDREIIQLIQSRCIHRRLGIVKDSDNVLYCQDCEKILYGKEAQRKISRITQLEN